MSTSSRAVAAASAAARDLGVAHDNPKVLYEAFSVIVHLLPSDTVVRVPTLLPPGTPLATQVRRQEAELAVTGWLAGTGFPVVPPSPLVPALPVTRDGFAMTFWQWVPTTDEEPDYLARTATIPQLHAALSGFPGEIGFMSFLDDSVDASFAVLAERPDLLPADDVARAREEWAVVRPVLADRDGFAAAFPDVPVQVIHGDAPSYNLLPTDGGPLFADFELTTCGPVEWDLALLPPEYIAVYDDAARELGLRAVDERVLALVNAGRMLQIISCLALADDMPSLGEAFAPLIEQWRGMPFAGGI